MSLAFAMCGLICTLYPCSISWLMVFSLMPFGTNIVPNVRLGTSSSSLTNGDGGVDEGVEGGDMFMAMTMKDPRSDKKYN